MRVIGGEFRSRVLKSPPGLEVRPTPDRLRESLFNVLAPRIEDVIFMDAYAGTGAVGIEALSRGASHTIFLERSKTSANLIRENLRALHLEARADIIVGKATVTLAKHSADIVFVDPPYDMEREYEDFLAALGKHPPALVIVQHDVHRRLDEAYGQLQVKRTLKHSDNILTFFEPVPAA
jgi:16S rRNA (guanine(966)-N(2))-methyltransferase RsmD